MKKKINLYWFKHKEGHGNFGDELNPYIVKKISDAKINYIDIEYLKKDKTLALKVLIYNFIKRKISLKFFINYVHYNLINMPTVHLVIGSVLQLAKIDKVIIWGSGIISKESLLPHGSYYAVRGYETIKRIQELGFTPPKVVGDPAILLPLIYTPKAQKKYKVGIIPHYVHYDFYVDKFNADFKVINLIDPLEEIIDLIKNCELVISTSLHGVIVAQVYGVNAIWAISDQKKLTGDNIKYKDYFGSVNIPDYEPLNMKSILNKNVMEVYNENVEKFKISLCPDSSIIKKIQKELIEVAPFEVKKELKK